MEHTHSHGICHSRVDMTVQGLLWQLSKRIQTSPSLSAFKLCVAHTWDVLLETALYPDVYCPNDDSKCMGWACIRYATHWQNVGYSTASIGTVLQSGRVDHTVKDLIDTSCLAMGHLGQDMANILPTWFRCVTKCVWLQSFLPDVCPVEPSLYARVPLKSSTKEALGKRVLVMESQSQQRLTNIPCDTFRTPHSSSNFQQFQGAHLPCTTFRLLVRLHPPHWDGHRALYWVFSHEKVSISNQ